MTTAVMERPVLVLNKSWAVLGTTTMDRALKKVLKERAKIVHPEDYQAMTWSDWSQIRPDEDADTFSACGRQFRIPEVIVLTHYDKLPQPRETFSRRMLFKRDHYTCQYCGCQPGSEELTLDHVVPRSQGGQTTWTNVVLACVRCNARKANRTPSEASMKLRTIPAKPKYALFKMPAVRIDSWSKFISDLYWTIPLQD